MAKLKTMKLKTILFTLGLSAITLAGSAQDYDLGFFGGTSFYQGDLSSTDNGFVNSLRGHRASGGLVARLNLHPNFSIAASGRIGYLGAYDRLASNTESTTNNVWTREKRNLSFHSPLAELGVMGELNILKYIPGSTKYRFTPYLTAGIALFYFEPRAFYDGDRVKLRKLATEADKPNYSPIQPSIPMGLGIKYNFKENLTLGVEFVWRKTFTDYIDDVSGKYPAAAYTVNSNSTLEQKLANRSRRTVGPNSKRGNPDNLDSYYFVGVTLTKTFRPNLCKD